MSVKPCVHVCRHMCKVCSCVCVYACVGTYVRLCVCVYVHGLPGRVLEPSLMWPAGHPGNPGAGPGG